MPVYNLESYLSKCIESIIKQTYSNIQIVLIDDGSTDNSGNICEEYAKEDKRIEVYHTENRGSVAARRLGIDVSNGEYIGFVDADDYIESNTFLELIEDIEKNNADFVHFGFIEEGSECSNTVCNYYDMVFELEDKSDRIDFLSNYVFEQMDISPSIWSKLFRADFIKRCYKNIPDIQQYGEDLICLCCCILEANKISLRKKALYHYIVRENSLSHMNNSKEYLIKEIELWNCIIRILEKYDCKDQVQESFFEFLKSRLFCLAKLIIDKKAHIPCYYFKDLKRIYGKRIVLYGAGNVGQDYFAQIRRYNNIEIIAWVDAKWDNYHYEYFDVVSIEKIKSLEYDIIIIAIENRQIAEEIKKILINNKFPEEKLEWQAPGRYY